MLAKPGQVRSHLFTVRVWSEKVDGGQVEWRGRIHAATNNETLFFREWEVMLAFLLENLDLSATRLEQQEAYRDEPNR